MDKKEIPGNFVVVLLEILSENIRLQAKNGEKAAAIIRELVNKLKSDSRQSKDHRKTS